MNRILLFASLLATLVLVAPLAAQRNDLGLRLGKLEAAWGDRVRHDDEARARALPRVEEAVRAFFGFRFARAAQALDEARLLLAGAEIDPAALWAASRRATIARRIVDPRAGEELVVALDAFYDAGPRPDGVTIAVALVACDSRAPIPAGSDGRGRDEQGRELVRLRLDEELGDHDLDLVIRIEREGRELDRLTHALASIPGCDERLARLAADSEREDRPADWRRASLAAGIADLRGWREGKNPENEPRPLAVLRALETIAGLGADAALDPGEYLLALPGERGESRLRIAVPAGASGKSPLLVLVHGAGGSENMFFEAYGGGRHVAEGLARDAIVVAPRAPLFGRLDLDDLLARLAAVRPFDRDRVYLVGHSMGAGIVLAAAGRSERPFAGVAAIAGGRRVADPKRLARSPLFLGTAARDFGRAGVLELAKQLEGLEDTDLVVRDIELSEHLLVVPDLLPELFRFLDAHGLEPR